MTATHAPRRAPIVSADIGEGHNCAGRAVGEAAARAGPGCEVGWLDALEAMGPGFGPLARSFYVTQVQRCRAVCGRNEALLEQLMARGRAGQAAADYRLDR